MEEIKEGPMKPVGNKGHRKNLKIQRDSVTIDQDKIKSDSRFDGKWVLKTNTDLSAEQVAQEDKTRLPKFKVGLFTQGEFYLQASPEPFVSNLVASHQYILHFR